MSRGNNDGIIFFKLEEEKNSGKKISYLFYIMSIWLFMYFLLTVFLKIIASKLKPIFLSRGNKMPENKKKLKIFIFANAELSFLILIITRPKIQYYGYTFLMIFHHFWENYWHFLLCPGETNYGKDNKKADFWSFTD